MNEQYDQQKDAVILGAFGRDVGKRFKLIELDKLTAASMALRLIAALRVDSYEDLLARLNGAPDQDGAPIEEILQLLQGSDPAIIEALMRESLAGMQVAPDPQHPEAFRPLAVTDIRELRTLGALQMAFFKLNFG